MKEPVKREPVAKEPVDKEPVNIDASPVNDDWIHTQAKTKKRAAEPIDEDGWRKCARTDCGSKFKPEPPSRAFCSDECAQINFYREHGMEHKAAALMASEKRDESGALVRKSRGGDDPDKEAKSAARYGPLRTVGEVLSETRGGKRVVFKECGHKGSVAKLALRGRCRVCKNEAANPGKVASAGVDAGKKPEREPVKREPVTLDLAKEFVRRGQAAQKAVNEEIKKATKRKPVTRKPARAKKPVKKKPVKRGKR